MLRPKLPFYKVYFYFVIILFTGGLIAAKENLFEKKKDKIENRIVVKDKFISSSQKRLLPPPVSSTDKSVKFIQTCESDTTEFFAVTSEDVDKIKYNFGNNDSATTTNTHLSYVYPNPGTYKVTITYYKGTDSVKITKDIVISAKFTKPDLGKDTAICPHTTYLLNPYSKGAAPAGATYVWQDGTTNPTLTVPKDSAATYWVAVTSGAGCTQVDQVEVTIYGQGRKRAAIWNFGQNAGLDFNKQPPAPKTNSIMNAPEGTATLSDIDGKLLFYTDGNKIYNKSNKPMTNGDSIGGSPNSTQSSIIIPWPGHQPYYYVFNTEEINSGTNRLVYSLVDLKADSAKGTVIFKNNYLYQATTERLTAYGSDTVYWLVTHDLASNTFRVFKITKNGVEMPPKLYNVGSVSTAADAEGSMKISSTGNELAVANGNSVELFHFNDTTGEVSKPVKLDVGSTPVYGIDFSPDGSKMYVTQKSPGVLYQYTVSDSLTGKRLPVDSIKKSKYQVATGSTFGALQIGPDGKMYMAVDFSGSLGVINNPNGKNAAVNFKLDGQNLAGKKSNLGLPNFVQSFFEPPPGPGISYQDSCTLSPIQFTGGGWGNRDKFAWDFNGEGTATTQQATHTFSTPGIKIIKLRVYNDCPMDTTVIDTITVINGPNAVNLGADRGMCEGGSVVLSFQGTLNPGETLLWSTLETTPSITVNKLNTYFLSVTNAGGCSQMGQVNVYNAGPTVNLGNDRTICKGDTAIINAGNSGARYLWSTGAVTRTITVKAPGQYTVAVTDPLTKCIGRDTININVIDKPGIVSILPSTLASCNATGTVDLTVDNNGPYTFEWTDASNPTIIATTEDLTTPVPAGFYQVRVKNLNGCDTLVAVALNPPTTIIQGLVDPIVCPSNAGLAHFSGLSNPPYVIQVYNQLTETYQFPTLTSEPIPLSEGVFTIIFTDNSNCKVTFPNIKVDPPANNIVMEKLGSDVSTCDTISIAATANPSYSYSWTPLSAVFSGQNSNIVVAKADPNGPVLLTLTVTNGSCTYTDNINIIPKTFSVDLGPDKSSCDGQGTFVVSPIFTPAYTDLQASTFSYLWTEATNPNSTISNSSKLSVNQSGTYILKVRNPDLGCVATNQVSVTINKSPINELGPDLQGCTGDQFVLHAGNAGATYNWIGPGVAAGQNTNEAVVATQTGVYGVEVSNNNCKATFYINVNLLQGPLSELKHDTVKFCSERHESRLLNAGKSSINLVYSWRTNDGGSDSNVGNRSEITVDKQGTYYVDIKDVITGCTTTDSVYVLDECEKHIFVPNAFTPGRGSTNNVFTIKGRDITKFNMTVFNRWGEIVYHTEQESGTGHWDGRTSTNQDAPSGTYAYIITYHSSKGNPALKFTQRGSIVLIR